MVEFNAGGLVGFFATLQKISAAIVKYGKEYVAESLEASIIACLQPHTLE